MKDSQQRSVANEASTRGIRRSRMMTRKHKRKCHIVLLIKPQSSTPSHAVFAFLNPLLVGVLQVHYQGSKLAPFETHKANLWVFLLATFIYCFALAFSKSYSKLAAWVASTTGSLCSVSILSIFLPHLLGKLIFVIWIFQPIYTARGLIVHVGQRVFLASKSAVLYVLENCNYRVIRSIVTAQRRCCV